MTTSRNDRNTVQFGPSRTPQSYQLDRLEEQVKDVERTTTEQIVNITGNAELLVGTVVTYTSVTTSGTVDIDGTVVDFTNASSVRLEADDVIILSANADYPDPFAVGLVSRDGTGYDLFSFALPGLVAGLPVDLGTSWANRDLVTGSNVGISKSLVVGDTIYTLADMAGDSIAYYDTGTPASGNLSAGGEGGSSTAHRSFAINGNVTAVFSGTGSTTQLAVHDGSTWTNYDYRYGNLEPNPQSGEIIGAFLEKNSTTTPVTGPFLVEISSTGVLTETNLSALFTSPVNSLQMVAGGGHVVISGANELYVDGVMYPYTFNAAGKLYIVASATVTQSGRGNAAWAILGDKLYFLSRASTNPMAFSIVPTNPLAVCVMDLTSPSLTTQVVNNVFSTTGSYTDGEPNQICSIAVPAANKVVVGGLWGWQYFEPTLGYGTDDYRATYAVINTTTGAVSLIAPTHSSLEPGDYGQTLTAGQTYAKPRSCTVAAEPGSESYYVFIYSYLYTGPTPGPTLTYKNIVDGGTV